MARAPLRQVVDVVSYATLVRQFHLNEAGLTKRPSPSAGALHPIDVLIVGGGPRPRVFRYDPHEHQLNLLCLHDPAQMHSFAARVSEALPDAHGTPLVLLAHLDRVSARYDDHLSLVWRDAGALLQTLFLTATAFDLAFSPLGMLGHELAKAIDSTNTVSAVGVAIIGRRPR